MMKVKKNLGTIDRLVRIIAGTILLSIFLLALFGQQSPWALLGLFGVFPLVAGIIGYCPPYTWLGIDTYKKRTPDEHLG